MSMISSIKPYSRVISFGKYQNPVFNEALRISKKLDDNGFEHTEASYYKFLNSEIKELKEASAKNDFQNMKEELGDVLFDIIMLAGYYGIDPVQALKSTNKKIETRINKAQELAIKPLMEYTLPERLVFWDLAKKELKKEHLDTCC